MHIDVGCHVSALSRHIAATGKPLNHWSMAGEVAVRVGQHILIVEGDDLVRALLERWLREAGYAAEVVEPGALEHRRSRADLIIANVASPRAAAPLVAVLRAAGATPILLISARLRRHAGLSHEVAQGLGVRSVLAKPFTRAELLTAVTESLSNGPIPDVS
jgi:DNA-binding response OmpR family regulator